MDEDRDRYNSNIDDELIELLRKRQRGEPIESAFGGEEAKLLPKTKGEKFAYFFYKYKTSLIVSLVTIVIAVSYTVYAVTKKKPDVSIVLGVGSSVSEADTLALENYVKSVTPDYNGDGSIVCQVLYIPFVEESSPQTRAQFYQKYDAIYATNRNFVYFIDQKVYDYTLNRSETAFANISDRVDGTVLGGTALPVPREKILSDGSATLLQEKYYVCIRRHDKKAEETNANIKQAYMYLDSVYKNIHE